MRWNTFTEHEAQVVEDNLTGWRDSQSLSEFRRIFPRPAKHSGFTQAVLALTGSGVNWDMARWAAGEAVCRLPQDASFEAINELARDIIAAYETLEVPHAA